MADDYPSTQPRSPRADAVDLSSSQPEPGQTGVPPLNFNKPPAGLYVDLPSDSKEGEENRALRTQARLELRQAQRTLLAVYKAHNKEVPPHLRAVPARSAGQHDAPAEQVTPSRDALRAGVADPSPGSSVPSLVDASPVTGPYAAGKKISKRRTARGLTFPSPKAARSNRSYRPVSSDLPYSLVTGDPTGALAAGYFAGNDILSDMRMYADYCNAGDERQHDLSPKLRRAGFLADTVSPLNTMPDRYQARKQTTVPRARSPATGAFLTPRVSSLKPPAAGKPGPTSLRESGGPSGSAIHEQAGTPVPSESDSEEGLVEAPITYDRVALDKLISKELPDKVDLDDSQAVSYLCMRFETVCTRHQVPLDSHTAVLESKLTQGKHTPFQEKTRLWAVVSYTTQARLPSGDLEYVPFKELLLKVAGGERLHYTRKTLATLSQKTSGSFDRYLADFETQAAYVQPSPSERLEVFQAGLSNNLRQRVLARSDGTDWMSWAEFLTVCKRFADVEFRSRELPVKALDTLIGTASERKGKRGGSDNSSKSTAAAKKPRTASPKQSSWCRSL